MTTKSFPRYNKIIVTAVLFIVAMALTMTGCGDPGAKEGALHKNGNPIDIIGVNVSENSFSSIGYFNEDYILITDENDLYGVADISGNIIITPSYVSLVPFGDNLVFQKHHDEGFGVMDIKKNEFLSSNVEKIEVFDDVLIATEMDGDDVQSFKFYDKDMNLIFDATSTIERCSSKYGYSFSKASYGCGVMTFEDELSGALVVIKTDTVNDSKNDAKSVLFILGDSYLAPANGYISVLNSKVIKQDDGSFITYPFINCETLEAVASPDGLLLSGDDNTVGKDGWVSVVCYEESGDEKYEVKKHGYYNVNSEEFTAGTDGADSCVYRQNKSVSVDDIVFEVVHSDNNKSCYVPYNLKEKCLVTEKQYKDIREKGDQKYYLVADGNSWFYCDDDFIIITESYKDATSFSNGFAYVKIGKKYVVVDEEFDVVSASISADGIDILSNESEKVICKIKTGNTYKVGYLSIPE